MKKKMAVLCMALALALAGAPAFGALAEDGLITVTIPAQILGGMDFSGLAEEFEEESGLMQTEQNEDGSITVVMTERGQREVLLELKDELDDGIEEILEMFPSLKDISYNYDLTEIEYLVDGDPFAGKGQELPDPILFEVFGGIYQALDLVPAEEIATEVTYVDWETGEIYEEGASEALEGGSTETEGRIVDPTDIREYQKKIRQLETENDRLKGQVAQLEAELAAAKNAAGGTTAVQKDVYGPGEIWTVAGQWNFSIDSVTVTQERNSYAENDPAQVVVVKYSYENLGYEGELMDLYFMISRVADETGEMGSYYPGSVSTYPQETPVGAKCAGAEEVIGLNHESSQVTIYMEEYDDTGERHKATFVIPVTQ